MDSICCLWSASALLNALETVAIYVLQMQSYIKILRYNQYNKESTSIVCHADVRFCVVALLQTLNTILRIGKYALRSLCFRFSICFFHAIPTPYSYEQRLLYTHWNDCSIGCFLSVSLSFSPYSNFLFGINLFCHFFKFKTFG